MIRRAWSDLAAAVRFLTVVPVPDAPSARMRRGDAVDPPDRGTPTTWFPAVGLGLGAMLLGLRAALPGEGLLAPALVLAAWTALTGGLHEDGWADCADAALPPVDRARRLEILRDPRVGAHGLVAVVLLLLVRLGGIAEAPAWALLVAPVMGRWAMVLSLAWARPLRPTGLGTSMAAAARPLAASAVAVAALACAVGVAAFALAPDVPLIGTTGLPGATMAGWGGGWQPPAAVAARLAVPAGVAVPVIQAVLVAALAGGGVGAFLHARFGGLSGDGHGAVGLAAETAALCSLALPVAGGWGAAIL